MKSKSTRNRTAQFDSHLSSKLYIKYELIQFHKDSAVGQRQLLPSMVKLESDIKVNMMLPMAVTTNLCYTHYDGKSSIQYLHQLPSDTKEEESSRQPADMA